jgi:hypothetical protein
VNRRTQCEKILALLQSANGQWVPLPQILALGCAQYSARIHTLRHEMGFHIENRTEVKNGVRHSWFRLTSGPIDHKVSSTAQFLQQWESSGSTSDLFGKQQRESSTLDFETGRRVR